MAALDIDYDGTKYLLDMEDLTTDQLRAAERFGVKNLKELEVGVAEGDASALQVTYWVMLRQNGQEGQRLERVSFKPVKFLHALATAAQSEADRVKAEAAPKEVAAE